MPSFPLASLSLSWEQSTSYLEITTLIIKVGPKIHQDVAIICAEGQANEEFTFKYLSESAEA